RYNLFVFKEKTKRIFTSIGAKGRYFAFLLSFQKITPELLAIKTMQFCDRKWAISVLKTECYF
ncbi:MAG TPA: hypothetical protein VFS71_07870, partial [Flavobacterium sp.]|uniref:hypothetical protein n=1 Tax=Flavobacterium sp. TaxID=239 RepID=UPI002DBE26B4